MMNLYDGEIRYTDDQVGVLFNELRELEVLDESLVLISSDHGDAFGEHGYFGHPRWLDNELVHVPLIIANRENTGVNVDTLVSSLDIVPTILDAVGVPSPDYPGRSLFANMDDIERHRSVFSQVRSEDDSVRRFTVRRQDMIASLEREISSGNIRSENWDEANRELIAELRQHSANHVDGATATEKTDPETNAEIKRRLEALGYKD